MNQDNSFNQNNFNSQENNGILNNQSLNSQNLNNNTSQNQNVHQNTGFNQLNFSGQYHDTNGDSFVQYNQNLNSNNNSQVNQSTYLSNQNLNNSNNISNRNKNKKNGIIIMIAIIVVILLVVFVAFLSKDKDNSDINNMLNNNDKIEYSEVLNNFGFYDNKYVFNASDNVTLNIISDVSSLYFSLNVNYERQLYEQIIVSVYNSYDDFKFNELNFGNSNVEYIINNDDEIFLIIRTEGKITYGLYGYAFGDDFISLSFNNNIDSNTYIDVELDSMKTMFSLCKSTIDLNNNNLSIGEKIKKYYLYNEYKIKDDYTAQFISKNGFIVKHMDNNVEYEMRINFETKYESLYEGETSTVDNFVIKLNSGDVVDSYVDIYASMEKNDQKIYFDIRRWNSDDKVTTNEIYELFNAVFEK